MEDTASQFTLDLEFAATFIVHGLIIFGLVFAMARVDKMWRWIGLPQKKKKVIK